MTEVQLIQKCFDAYNSELSQYKKMQNYYRNNSDVRIEKSDIDTTSTNKTDTNYLKKFIKSETDYILSNPITFINKTENVSQEEDTVFNLSHWKKDHDKSLFRRALLYGKCYELYFCNSESLFMARIITPLNGYAFIDENDDIKLFLHMFSRAFQDGTFIDVYIENRIIHYKTNGNSIGVKTGEDTHIFNNVPVGICSVDDNEKDVLFYDIKSLQDAYETNLSDLSHEISQYRQSYLKIINATIENTDLPEMKKSGILQCNGENISVDWLIKEINDSFVHNTLKEIKQNIYELANHINNNEQVPSNNSSLAMQTRQLDLGNKCKSNVDAMFNLIKIRLKFLYKYLYLIKNIQYDFRLLDPQFTPSLPQDDLLMAQIISQVPEYYFSKATGRAQFSFIDNVALEDKRVRAEKAKDEEEEFNKVIDLEKVNLDLNEGDSNVQ